MLLEIIAAVLILATLFFLYLIYSGLLSSVVIKVQAPPITSGNFFYKFHQQNYRNSGAAFRELQKFPVKSKLCMGIYYDDPEQCPQDQARSAIGIFISDEKNCDELKETMLQVGYSHIHFPEVKKAVVTVFPFKTMFSIFIAVFRVYPRLKRFVSENKLKAHPCMEVYRNNKIYFVSPLEESENFYVSEFHSSSL